jgi:hypothetical protein
VGGNADAIRCTGGTGCLGFGGTGSEATGHLFIERRETIFLACVQKVDAVEFLAARVQILLKR